MKRVVVALVVVVLAASGVGYLALRGGPTQQTDGPPSPTASVTGPGYETRFGVMLSTRLFDIGTRVDLAAQLGVGYLRSSAVLTQSWDGRCPECQVVHDAGLRFVLTIRNGPTVTAPAGPPEDLKAYGELVREVLLLYRPALVVIENEENSRKFYSGTAEEYGAQLRVACEVAHDLDTPCTNGGLLSGSVAFLVYQHYVEIGDLGRAEDFATRAFEGWQMNRLQSSGGPQWVEARVREVSEFLHVYRSAGADFVNFHWYVADPGALGETVTYLQDATGLPPVTNEIGQRDLDPGTTTSVLTGVRDLGLAYAVWFAIDATLARGLVEPDGTLRQTGEAFRSFLRDNFP